MKRGVGFWILIMTGILITILLLVGQTFSLINYETAVSLGLQESSNEVTEVGIAFAKGFAFADTFIYIPLLLAGIIGLLKRKRWSVFAMFGTCAISIYWPMVHLYAIYAERDVITLNPEKYVYFPIVLSFIILYGLWGLWYVYKNQKVLVK